MFKCKSGLRVLSSKPYAYFTRLLENHPHLVGETVPKLRASCFATIRRR